MPLPESLYRVVLRAARVAAPLASRGESKLARGLRGRRGAVERLERWAERGRDADRPLVWIHAPSVGEGLQARAVLEALQELRVDLQSVFTHFSPSAEALAGAMPSDVADYLPWDLPGPMRRALEALRPDLVVFTKTEVWPTLSALARRMGIPTALVAATLPEESSRARPLARRLLGPAYGRLTAVLAIAEEDAERLRTLGATDAALAVSGDPGIDSAAERAAAAAPEAPWLAPFAASRAPVLVAGSTWPEDEAVLLPALARIRERGAVLPIIAPHEPGPDHLEPLLAGLRETGWRPGTLAEVESAGGLGEVDAVAVERVGVLAQLYTVGDLAYVGGGFGEDGLHSVLEPAAAGLPVLFGPRHSNARAASDLLRLGGAVEVGSVEGLVGAVRAWIDAPGGRASSAEAALRYIDSHRGAAMHTARRLAELLPPPSDSRDG